MTNRKLHISYRLVPNSVTLNDLERRNRPNGWVISPNSVTFWADCVKVVEYTDTFCGRNVGQTMYVLAIISFMAILAGDLPKR